MQDLQTYVGKTVRIKRLRQDKMYGLKRTNKYMVKYNRKKAVITEVIEPGEIDEASKQLGLLPIPEITEEFPMYHIDLDNGQYFWTKEMFRFGRWILKEK